VNQVVLVFANNLFIDIILKDEHPVYAEEEFIAFKNIDVKLSGIGQKTVIQFMPLAGTKPQTLAIPNDRIIVLPTAPQS